MIRQVAGLEASRCQPDERNILKSKCSLKAAPLASSFHICFDFVFDLAPRPVEIRKLNQSHGGKQDRCLAAAWSDSNFRVEESQMGEKKL